MHWVAKKITHFFIQKNIVSEDDADRYIYSFEVLLSNIINIIILLIGAIVTSRYYETAVFAIVFISLRKFSGGYHSSTNIGCLILLLLAFVGFILLLTFVSIDILNDISKILSIFSVLVIFIFSPIDNHSNPISENYKKKGRVISIIIVSLVAIIGFILNFLLPRFYFTISMSYAALCVSISVVAGKISYIVNDRKQNKKAANN